MKIKLKILSGTALLLTLFFYACNNHTTNLNDTSEKAAKIDVKKAAETEINYLSEDKKIAREAQAVLEKNWWMPLMPKEQNTLWNEATGYAANELRGMRVVEMDKK